MSRLDDLYHHSLALLTDLYQLTMACGYWKTGRAEHDAVFHLFFRRHPFGGDYTIACGLTTAIEYLETVQAMDTKRVGLYGVGMGAHAAVLAAADQPRASVLVLDGLYPDAGYPLAREVWSGWSFGVRRLAFLPRSLFALTANVSIGAQRAADALPRLTGRDLLLVAPENDPSLSEEMRRMYDAIPDQLDADGNLVFLPATIGEGLYGEELSRYHDRVTGFFRNRL